jgi:hypothetical protein
MDPASIAAIGGLGLSALGSIFSGSSAKKQAQADRQAAEEARNFGQNQYSQGQLRQLALMLGGDRGLQLFRALASKQDQTKVLGQKATDPTFSDQQRARLAEIDRQLGLGTSGRSTAAGIYGGVGGSGTSITPESRARLEQERKDLIAAAGGQAGVTGQIDENAIRGLGSGVLGEYDKLRAQSKQAQGGILSDFDAGTAQLAGSTGEMRRSVANYGKKEEERIRRDTAESFDNANRAANNTALSRGMGASSFLTDAYGANARDATRTLNDGLGGIADNRTRLNLGVLGQGQQMLAGRLQGRSGLMSGAADRDTQLGLGAANVYQSAVTGSVMNPWLGQNVTQYFPSASPSASAMGTFGSAFAGLGSTAAGYGLQALLDPDRKK